MKLSMASRALVLFSSTHVLRAFSIPAGRVAAAAAAASGAHTCTARNLAAATTEVITENPLLQQEDLPKFSKIQPSNLSPAVETLLEQLEREFDELESSLQQAAKEQQKSDDDDDKKSSMKIGYDQVLPEIEKMQFPLGYTWGVAGHLNGVQNSDELRNEYEANQPKIVQVFSKFSQSRPIYDALSAIEQTLPDEKEENDIDFDTQQRRRAVELSLRSMKLGGVGLDGKEKERFNEIRTKLASLSTTFSNNVLDETKAFAVTVTDPSQLENVPESAMAMWANAYTMHMQKEDRGGENDSLHHEMDQEKGPWRITLDMPSYIAVLSHVPDRALREKVYMANIQRASEQNPDKNNVPLIYEILQLKHEMANMLGFNNYAELSLASKMAPSIDSVQELSDLILEKALPAAEKELDEITKLAKEKGGDEYQDLDKLMPWDVTFWSERLKESKFDLTEEETRPYFALPAVLDGMFNVVNRLFNVQVVAADGETEVWHPDVRFFKVLDADSGKHVASFFLDPYSRPENKRGGAWMDVCIGKSEAVARDVPVAYLTCNGSPPVGSKPSLMTFREVETLFHEFGHGLQHMLTKASVGDVAGINGVEWDAVELPSQFMENWCYDEATMYGHGDTSGLAKHWETGEPMPRDMFEKLKEQKTFNAGMMACRQLQFGQLDMALHSEFDPSQGPDGGETIFDVQRRIAKKYTPYNMPLPEDRFLCTFGHIFAGGYAAGYYSYKWAEVMSADAFSAFEDVGLDNEDKVKEVGRKFRDTVLSLGGGVDPTTVFKEFRGREPSPDALLRHNGLA